MDELESYGIVENELNTFSTADIVFICNSEMFAFYFK